MQRAVATVVFAVVLVAAPSGSARSTAADGTASKLADVYELAVDPARATKVYVATGHGLEGSTDGGRTWNEVWSRVYPTGNRESVFFVAVHPRRPQIVYISTEGAGVLKTTDGGRTWSSANRGLGSHQ